MSRIVVIKAPNGAFFLNNEETSYITENSVKLGKHQLCERVKRQSPKGRFNIMLAGRQSRSFELEQMVLRLQKLGLSTFSFNNEIYEFTPTNLWWGLNQVNKIRLKKYIALIFEEA